MTESGTEPEGRHVKLSITLPPGTAEVVKAAVEAGTVSSASAFIAAAIDAAAARARTKAWIREMNGGPIDEDARAHWIKRLGLADQTPGQVSA